MSRHVAIVIGVAAAVGAPVAETAAQEPATPSPLRIDARYLILVSLARHQ